MSTPWGGSSARLREAPSRVLGPWSAHLMLVAVTPVRSPGGSGAVVGVVPDVGGWPGWFGEPGAPGVPGAPAAPAVPAGPEPWLTASAFAAEPTAPPSEMAASAPLSGPDVAPPP